MSKAIENLQAAQQKAIAIRPKVCNGEEYVEGYPAVEIL